MYIFMHICIFLYLTLHWSLWPICNKISIFKFLSLSLSVSLSLRLPLTPSLSPSLPLSLFLSHPQWCTHQDKWLSCSTDSFISLDWKPPLWYWAWNHTKLFGLLWQHLAVFSTVSHPLSLTHKQDYKLETKLSISWVMISVMGCLKHK